MTQPTANVTTAYQQQTAATRAQLAVLLAALWQSLPDYRNHSLRDFTRRAVPLVEGAMAHMQALTAAYLATLSDLNGGNATPVATAAVGIAAVRNGADPLEVYGRPFHLVWRQLHELKPLDSAKITQAITAGEKRVQQLALTDLQLAKTHTSRAQIARNRDIVGYRRQLEGPHSCALCVVAATRLYHRQELMPIHPACDCSVVPVFKGETTDGITINPALLDAAHATVADLFGADSTAARRIRGAFKGNGEPILYRDVLIEHQHGELGPILGMRGQGWTGPGDIAA